MVAIKPSNEQVYQSISKIVDPEIPFLTIEDLGILRELRYDFPKVTVIIAPTYLACPATDTIEEDIASKLLSEGFTQVDVRRQFSPPWTTDWITGAGRDKMRRFGISPPQYASKKNCRIGDAVICPRCGSSHHKSLSDVGSTLCKSLFRCLDCQEVYEHFKCL